MVVPPAVEHFFWRRLFHAQHLGVFLRKPRRPGPAGRGEHGLDAVLMEQVHHLVHPLEGINALPRLQVRPGENADGEGVYAGRFGESHVLFPNGIFCFIHCSGL
jgi:hypothetical protein